ncbi:hypothetical protein PAHAL_5G252900 [Panicum hallii]|uniref:F-box domain-containing protein n=1 Tax=Panicum hallii TaxID=206008 RepID=A0A2T8IL69_9POAL|nr:uncharacterized protein LOC112891577 [Panicum hallii]XP_025814258.1 uncharacterized protein LOC112891577 [Panicum hallii]XP_025814259.1 uncharacterized protein LOC112891577 [Panicum hallii]PAN29840.1 hypothetical protein PAHAL_5G252900 [Panicum hallii]PVH38412.1 hypothetical protein PAHAL_5G252900 [Panicum hallii]PVH38413.1 hypothetical protein PAHAL_5G252900 [Panicum hallii]PVH38414.1 hypothetical protein PAHAL_5G252900 [Panicum hallii]
MKKFSCSVLNCGKHANWVSISEKRTNRDPSTTEISHFCTAAAVMARDRSPTNSPPAKRRKDSSTTTTIASLGEDILLEIFLRLPCLATLVRAALTCRGWRRAVASSPAFRRRFRQLHPAPLLGLFFNPPGAVQEPGLPAFPSFVPTRGTDRDQAAAVRGGDFFLTSLQERPGVLNGWDIHDCRGGYVLLANGGQETMAVVNPLARRSERFFDSLDGHRVYAVGHRACLLCSDEDPTAFRVVIVAHDKSRDLVRATVFCSDTGEWSVRPWVHIPGKPRRGRGEGWMSCNMQAKGFLYWVYKNRKYMLTLDTATMDFSVDELPIFLQNRFCSFVVGEMKNGEPCIVYAINFIVGVLLRRTEKHGVDRWVLDRAEPLETQLCRVLGKVTLDYNKVKVVAVRDGFVYLATSDDLNDSRTPSWFLSLCLETMILEKLFQRTYDSSVHPYVMQWPPSLVGNYGRFAPEDGT